MITPSKFVTLENSIIAKLPPLLSEIPGEIELSRLYAQVNKQFSSVDQFMLSLDVLYLLGYIDVDFKTRTVTYVA